MIDQDAHPTHRAPPPEPEDPSALPLPPILPSPRLDLEARVEGVAASLGEVLDVLERIEQRLDRIERHSAGAESAAHRAADAALSHGTRLAQHEARIDRLVARVAILEPEPHPGNGAAAE